MISAVDLSKYLIYLIKEKMRKCGMNVSEEFDVTPSRLQKLLYYCQAYSLAFTGNKIFSDTVEIKENRPFIKSIYEEYQDSIVSCDENISFENIDKTTRAIIRNVICDKIGISDYALTAAIQRSQSWPECLL